MPRARKETTPNELETGRTWFSKVQCGSNSKSGSSRRRNPDKRWVPYNMLLMRLAQRSAGVIIASAVRTLLYGEALRLEHSLVKAGSSSPPFSRAWGAANGTEEGPTAALSRSRWFVSADLGLALSLSHGLGASAPGIAE
mmetsp:Transcript_83646/g.194484  ORF Transcript_83646/g.194484 Transcript_83646/m.194484 type:complete len:140 (+) Transcript_83646:1759-2178(+)